MNAADSFVPLAFNRSAASPDNAGGSDGFVPTKPVKGDSAPRPGTAATPSPTSHAGASPASVVAPRPHVDHGRPVVTLRREGDQLTGIRIECTCGKVIELDCLY